MSTNNIKIISDLLLKLNDHIIQINDIIFEMNNTMNKINDSECIENMFKNTYMDQMNELVKKMNSVNYNININSSISLRKLNLSLSEKENESGTTHNIIFKTTLGMKTTIEFNSNLTVDELLKQYLTKINKTHLINNSEEKLYFTYNSENLELGDDRKIENVFKSNINPTILVSEF